MSIAPEIVDIAVDIKPDQATLVPEKREELTTEGGLDVAIGKEEIGKTVKRLQKAGIKVSLFIDPDDIQVKVAGEVGADLIELHTGSFANAADEKTRNQQLEKLTRATDLAIKAGLKVAAGHGLNYQNVKEVAGIRGIEELNIGHSIISRAVFAGLDKAVREMIGLIRDA
jgi:pyridoxine 5-phosphate synthase